MNTKRSVLGIIFLLMNVTINSTPLGVGLYLDLLKKSLLNSIYQDDGNVALNNSSYDQIMRENGWDWPHKAFTMIGLKRLNNIQFCVEDVLRNNVPGDLIETGVWRGGATIFMRGILKAYGDTQRTVWVADSFCGLPEPNSNYPADKGDGHHIIKFLAVSLDEVKNNFDRHGLLDSQVQFLKGWFKDTLPHANIKQLAVMRLDGDMYESTMDALNNLYPKLSINGYVIIDDYGCLANCRKAVDDFRAKHNITDEINIIDTTGVYWKKTSHSSLFELLIIES